jgi:ribosomal protein L29
MTNQEFAELSALNINELNAQITSAKKELFELRLALSTGANTAIHKFKMTRKRIARLSTVLTKKKKEV